MVGVVNADNDGGPQFTGTSPAGSEDSNCPEPTVEEPVDEDSTSIIFDGLGVVVESQGSTVMSESGSSDSFTFALASEPVTNVVVSVASSDLSEAAVSMSTLTFTPANWDTPQTVVVTGMNDGLDDGDQMVDVTLSADGFDPVVVGVVNADND